jgi:hypothetical protein
MSSSGEEPMMVSSPKDMKNVYGEGLIWRSLR